MIAPTSPDCVVLKRRLGQSKSQFRISGGDDDPVGAAVPCWCSGLAVSGD